MYNFLRPEYFDKFVCTGSDCDDNCCKDWRIDIDLDTYEKYLNLEESEFKKKLLDHMIVDRYENGDIKNIRMKLVNGKCVFLNEEKLCGVYKELGEEYMGNVCQVYPRTHSIVNGYLEGGLYLSCIEVARLVLKDKNPIKFILNQKDIERKKLNIKNIIQSENSDNLLEKYFGELNLFSIRLLQNRNLSIEDRLVTLGMFFSSLEKDSDDIIKIISDYEKNISKDMYKNVSKELINNVDLSKQIIHLSTILVDFINKGVLINKSYINFIIDIYEYFEFGNTTLDKLNEKFNDAKIYYNNFMKDKTYIFENYVVNNMFINNFPYSKNTPISVYIDLILDFIVVKFITICIFGVYKENTTEDLIIKLIQSYSVCIQHDLSLTNKIKTYLDYNDINTLANMFFMINS